MRLRQISEAGFLRQLRHYLGAAGGSVRLSVGDDAAVLTCPAGYSLVLTCDAAVEGCHFRRDWLSEAEIGDRAVRACISDLAAMGAQPAGVLLTLVISPDETEAAAHALVHGAAQAAEVLGTRLIGGETVGNPGPLMLDVMAAGFVPEGRELRRDGAQPGDRLLVSGTLGDSAAGLAALQATLTSPAAHVAVARYRQPKPHLALGALLAAT
ncbi:MAG: thiamine-phosphate kinase, partial [Candidatus Zipacnadales bacterium]